MRLTHFLRRALHARLPARRRGERPMVYTRVSGDPEMVAEAIQWLGCTQSAEGGCQTHREALWPCTAAARVSRRLPARLRAVRDHEANLIVGWLEAQGNTGFPVPDIQARTYRQPIPAENEGPAMTHRTHVSGSPDTPDSRETSEGRE